ncbi:MAG: choice-of-anchor D domain-containing protein, partial [Candidatus Hodarchaeota archaeon]
MQTLVSPKKLISKFGNKKIIIQLIFVIVLISSGSVDAQKINEKRISGNKDPLPEQIVPFDLGPGHNENIFLFEIKLPCVLEILINWEGTAKTLNVNLAGKPYNINPDNEDKSVEEVVVSFEGSSPIDETVEIQSNQIGNWGISLKTTNDTAKGELIIKPSVTKAVSNLERKYYLPQIAPEPARLVSLFFYSFERYMLGLNETELDQKMNDVFSNTHEDVRHLFEFALLRYKSIPFETKVEHGFDPDLLRRLENVYKPISKSEIQKIGKKSLSSVSPTVKLSKKADLSVIPHRFDLDSVRNILIKEDEKTKIHSVLVDMSIGFSRIECHDESDACLFDNFGCTETGSDETVAIFVVLDINIFVDINYTELRAVSADCADEFLLTVLAREWNSPEWPTWTDQCKELIEGSIDTTFSVDYWIDRTEVFVMNDGDQKFRSGPMLWPQNVERIWDPLEMYVCMYKNQENELIYQVSSPARTVLTILIELDNGIGLPMQLAEIAVKSILENHGVYMEIFGEMLGAVALDALEVGDILCASLKFLYTILNPPDILGFSDMGFTPFSFEENGARYLSHRGMFDRNHSDYEIDFSYEVIIGGATDSSRIETIPSGIAFGEVGTEEHKLIPLKIKNVGNQDLKLLTMYATDDHPRGGFGINLNAGESPCGFLNPVIPPGGFCTIGAVFAPKKAEGYSGEITLKIGDRNNLFQTIGLSGIGVAGDPDLHIYPDNINFGEVFVGYSDSIDITLSNAGTGMLKIIKIDRTSHEFSLSFGGRSPCETWQPKLLEGESCTFTVTYKPISSGTDNFDL